MKTSIAITSLASVSPLGHTAEAVWARYRNNRHYFTHSRFGNETVPAAFLAEDTLEEIRSLKETEAKYRHLDNTVLYALFTARNAIKNAGWQKGQEIGVNIGSSRGATALFEHYHESFLKAGRAETMASPSTTLGNISSWVAQDLLSSGPDISHSVTCSTGLHAILNGVAWLESGLAEKFLAGGSEAALTPFTVAQMKAMKIYAANEGEYPCQALNLHKTRNTMILGEGAALVGMEKGKKKNALAYIGGIGYATEELKHSVSISANGSCFQKSMKMAIGDLPSEEIDAIVLHAPGTVKGDLAEVAAINEVFGTNLPALTTNKWKIGHTFGASGTLSLELGILMLMNQEFIAVPFLKEEKKTPEKLENVLVNAVGFGGNAVSILLRRAK